MTMDASALFAQLALRPDASERDVRRAYAVELKKIDQEAQPEAFQALRETYDRLLLWLRHQQAAQQAHELRQEEVKTGSAAVDNTDELCASQTGPAAPHMVEPQPAVPVQTQEAPVSNEALAREMLQLLVHRFETRAFTDRDSCAAFLAECMDDPRLEQVDARQYFEWGIASILAGGWRPGHELLFAPAMECFAWQQDRTRLLWLGRPGQLLDAAIAELAVFDGQPGADRSSQRDVIRALRSGVRPTTSELVKQLPIAEFVAGTFPNWLHVISPPQTVQTWRASLAAVPNQGRNVAVPSKPATKKSAGEPGSSNIGGMIFLALLVLGALSKLSFGPPPMQSPGYSAPAARRTAVPSAGYAARVAASIKPNVVFSRVINGNPSAVIEVRTAADGTILDRNLVKSSGVTLWDAAAVNAIDKTKVLPLDVNGQVPEVMVIALKPKD